MSLDFGFRNHWPRNRTCFASVLLTILTVNCLGCNSQPDRVAIDGQVRFKNGNPVGRGSIGFAPLDQGPGVTAGAVIVGGHYHIPKEKGLRVGKYIVRIYASDSTLAPQQSTSEPNLPALPGHSSLPPALELVSAQYNAESKLVAEVQTITNQQQFDFEVE